MAFLVFLLTYYIAPCPTENSVRCITTHSLISISLFQKRSNRIFTSAGFRALSEPLFKIHNVLKVDDIYQQRSLMFHYNVVNNMISANFHLYYLRVNMHIPYKILRDNYRNIRMSI